MSNNSIQLQPAYLLHHHFYRETSLIIDVLTRDYGRFSAVAKGVRKPRSKYAAILRPFQLLNLSVSGKSEMKTLTYAETTGKVQDLKGLALYSGYYANELIYHLLHKHDPHPEVFENYQQCLEHLQMADDIEFALRCFEFNLLDKIGYGMHFGYDIKHQKAVDSSKKYRFNDEHGLVEDNNGQFSGVTLKAIQEKRLDNRQVRNEAKMLMRIVIDSHLQGKQLKSRTVVNDILKRLNHE